MLPLIAKVFEHMIKKNKQNFFFIEVLRLNTVVTFPYAQNIILNTQQNI